MSEPTDRSPATPLPPASGLPAGGEQVIENLQVPDEIRADFDALVRGAAGQVWARPGIELRMRSAITIAMLSALVRPHELRVHVGMGLDNGLSREEICEVILHAAIYGGFPCAVRAMDVAKRAFEERDRAAG